MVVKIQGAAARNRAIDWCIENLSSIDSWDTWLVSDLHDYSSHWTYNFMFDSEADAVWFSLVHGDSIL